MGNGNDKDGAMNQLVWEEDIDIFASPSGYGTLSTSWHLKRIWDSDNSMRSTWKVSLAWINKGGDRKYHLRFARNNCDAKTFRSLKAAKAYALAIITLEN